MHNVLPPPPSLGRLRLTLFLLLALLPASAAFAQQFTVGAYHLQSSVRVSPTQYDYTYTLDLTNSSDTANQVVAAVTSSSPNTLVTKASVQFGAVPASTTVTSTDTFTIRQDRRFSFLPSSLSWTFRDTSSPTANAGVGQTVPVGTLVTLNGTASADPAYLRLSYTWTLLSTPPGSQTAIQNPTAPLASLLLDAPGNYVAQLVVSDGTAGPSAPATVTFSTAHTPPTANAGPNQGGSVGELITLDGSASVDPDGAPLTYTWTFLTKPAGSNAAFSDPSAVQPSFTLDRPGSYIAQLVVSDAFGTSQPSTVQITVGSSSPIAIAGPSQTVPVGTLVRLSGLASTDPNGFPLTYTWGFVSLPPNSSANGTLGPLFSFQVDVPGNYVVQLIVSDGQNDSQPVTVTISTTQPLPPVAVAGPAQAVGQSTSVQLDGSGSYDPSSLPLTYSWSFLSKPSASAATFSNSTGSQPLFTPDTPGLYVAQLIVSDNDFVSTPSTVAITITATAPTATITPNPIAAHTGVSTPALLTLSSPAPAAGAVVTLSLDNAVSCTTVSPITVPAHTTSVTISILCNAPGVTTFRASSPLFAQATATVNVTATPTISVGTTIVGSGAQAMLPITFTAPPSTGNLTLTSNDPRHFLLSASPTTPGSTTLIVPLFATGGTPSIVVYLQGQNYTGTAAIFGTITASATGFDTGTGIATLYPTGVAFYSGNITTTTLSAPDPYVMLQLLLLNPGTLTYVNSAWVSPQAPLVLTVADSNPTVGTLSGNPAIISNASGNRGLSSALTFTPLVPGVTTLSFTEPPGYATPTPTNTFYLSQITATVTQPAITLNSNIVGNNACSPSSFTLQYPTTAAETLTLTTNDPTHFLLSPDAHTIGSTSITLPLARGATSGSFYIQGQNYSGTAAVTGTFIASAPGYLPTSTTATLYPTGVSIGTSGFSTTPFSGPTPVQIGLLLLNPGSLTPASGVALLSPQTPPIAVTVTSSDLSVGTITGNPAVISNAGGSQAATVNFNPAANGITTLAITEPAGYYTGANAALAISAFVASPTISSSASTVGNNAISRITLTLTAPTPSAELLTVTSSDPTHFLLSNDPNQIGSAGLTQLLSTGATSAVIYVEGQNYPGGQVTGSLIASAPGFAAGNNSISLYPTGIAFDLGGTSISLSAPPLAVTVGLFLLDPQFIYLSPATLGPQAGPISVQINTSNPSTGTLTNDPAQIAVGATYGSVSFTPVSLGVTTLSVTEPPGYYQTVPFYSSPIIFPQFGIDVTP